MSRSRNRKRPHPVNKMASTPVTSPPQPVPQPRKRRVRSTYVILGSVGTLFAGLCVYGVVRDRDRNCVDNNNNVVSNRECEDGSGGARWYYGGSNFRGKMSGGSFERAGFGGHGSTGS